MATTDYETTFRLKKLNNSVTLRVKVIETPEYKLRYWLFKKLTWLACSILGCAVVVEE
jgi:hypothetical protein